MRQLLPLGLRSRITLIVSLTVVLPMTIAMVFAGYRARIVLYTEAKNELAARADSLLLHMAGWDQEMVKLTRNLSYQPEIVSMNPERQQKALEQTDKIYEEIYLLHTIAPNGWDIARNDQKKLTFYGDRHYFKEAIKGINVPRQIFIGRTSGKPTVSFASPIRDVNQSIVGVVAISTALDSVSQRVSELSFGSGGIAFVVDSDNNLLAHSDLKTVPKALAQRLNTENSKEIQNLSEYAPIQCLRQKQSGWCEFTDEGIKWISYVAVVPNAGWGVVAQRTEAGLLEKAHSFLLFSLFIILLVLSVVMITTWLVATQIVKPIGKLTEAATAIAAGDLEQKVVVPSQDEIGILAQAFNSMADQLKASFQELEAKNNDLQKLDKLKDDFLANTSHELRTPLYGIIGITESLIDGVAGPISKLLEDNLQIIIASGRRLSSLVNDILDFSKLKNNHMELQLKAVDIQSLIKIVITLFQPLIRHRDLQIIYHPQEHLPLVYADENRVQQILYNLIGNAVKFTHSGQIEIEAHVHEELTHANPLEGSGNPAGFLIISVRDTGIGIKAEQRDRIFESFEQGDGSTARIYGGTGLGLSITKQLVELQGGSISVESTLGEGSCFRFSLPIAADQVLKTGSDNTDPALAFLPQGVIDNESSQLSRATTSDLALLGLDGKIKILIVDDEPINLQVLYNNLSLEKYQVYQAKEGIEALSLLETGLRPDLILLDVMMPNLTGYEVAEKIRQTFLPSQLPIVMLTAKNQVEDLLEGLACGANDYLVKPFSKKELLARIKTHLYLSRINLAYERFVPSDFLSLLGKESIIDIQLGDQVEKEMGILFSDIRSFTTISEKMTPQENFNFINHYLSQTSPLIRAHQGFIDKYMGDSIMALFPSAQTALDSAIAMQKQVRAFNQQQQEKGAQTIAIGVGLHWGSLMLGTIGERQRMEGTVIADAVNLAARLEDLTKTYGASIIVSEAIIAQLDEPHGYSYRFLDQVQVKGKTQSVAIYEVLVQQ